MTEQSLELSCSDSQSRTFSAIPYCLPVISNILGSQSVLISILLLRIKGHSFKIQLEAYIAFIEIPVSYMPRKQPIKYYYPPPLMNISSWWPCRLDSKGEFPDSWRSWAGIWQPSCHTNMELVPPSLPIPGSWLHSLRFHMFISPYLLPEPYPTPGCYLGLDIPWPTLWE